MLSFLLLSPAKRDRERLHKSLLRFKKKESTLESVSAERLKGANGLLVFVAALARAAKIPNKREKNHF